MWDGLSSEDPFKSPKSQVQPVGFPLEPSEKLTVRGAKPLVVSALNSATGVSLTVM